MLLLIDIGNTNTVFALMRGDSVLGEWRLATHAHRTADEYATFLLPLAERAGLSLADVTGSALASVVPACVFEMRRFCSIYAGGEPLVLGAPGVSPGIEVKVDRPAEVGADRLVNALAASRAYPCPLVVVDFGTATTFDVVDETGAYAGGVIAPGIHLSLEALTRAAARLSSVPIAHPARVVGTNTADAMQSGLYFGYLGLIEGIIERIQQERGSPVTVIATGGLAPLFAGGTKSIHHVAPDLTLRGLCAMYQINCNA